MDPRIEFNDRQVEAALAHANLQSAGQMLPVFRRIGGMLKASTQERFRSQRGPNGSPWHKVRRGGQALRLSGRLRNSITYQADARSVEVGTNVVYARAHQEGINDPAQPVKGHKRLVRTVFGRDLRFPVWGTVRPFTRHMRIWARPYLGFSDDDRGDILDALVEHVGRFFRPTA